ncbi:hypothetical protein AAHA92_08909 [Salvia divinorum]|uniref:Uncharacterized protein n=1 Tax=Salvia divinorum TaxID=28513 RepID=A0ABD1HT65_SALDI
MSSVLLIKSTDNFWRSKLSSSLACSCVDRYCPLSIFHHRFSQWILMSTHLLPLLVLDLSPARPGPGSCSGNYGG